MIPRREYELELFRKKAERYRADGLIVMLGGNDLLTGTGAREVALRMEALLTGCIVSVIFLIAPPMKRGAWVPDDHFVEESRELSRQYAALAERLGLQYADAGEWNINLAYDGVPFSEEGCIFRKECPPFTLDQPTRLGQIAHLSRRYSPLVLDKCPSLK